MKKIKLLCQIVLVTLVSMSSSANVNFERAGFEVSHYLEDKVQFADINNDGSLDALSSRGSSEIHIHQSLNNGYVVTSRQIIGGGEFILHDINDDGFEDIITFPFRISLNDGNGYFPAISTVYSVNGIQDQVKMQKADLDGNGELDIVLSTWVNNGYDYGFSRAYLNVSFDPSSPGYFSYERELDYKIDNTLIGLDAQTTRGVAIGDLNNDGSEDIIFVNAKTQYDGQFFTASGVVLNQGEGSMVLSQYISNANDIALGDVDGDGDLDAYLAKADSPYFAGSEEASDELWLNDGSGSFVKSSQVFGDFDSVAVSLVDIDNDLDLDVVVVHQNIYGFAKNQAHAIWLNDGLGNFTESGFDFGGEYVVKDMDVVDIDQDGDMDIVLLGGSQPYDETSSPEYRNILISNNEIWLNQLVPNNNSENGFQSGIEFCIANPEECGLFDLDDINLEFEEGVIEGRESCLINPASCNLFDEGDLVTANEEGRLLGVDQGISSCINDPLSCGLFDQEELEEAYQIGVSDGKEQCISDPSYCGLFGKSELDNLIAAKEKELMREMVASLPRGIVLVHCILNRRSPLCEFVEPKHKYVRFRF